MLSLSFMSLLASNVSFAVSDGPVELNLSGSVAAQISIDISEGITSGGTSTSQSSDVGDLKTSKSDVKVASLGVLTNNGYQIKMYADNGEFACDTVATPSCTGRSLAYTLAMDALTPQAPPVGSESAVAIHPAVGEGEYECSLVSGCPGTASSRHDITLSTDGDPTLSLGNYKDRVLFVIQDQSL